MFKRFKLFINGGAVWEAQLPATFKQRLADLGWGILEEIKATDGKAGRVGLSAFQEPFPRSDSLTFRACSPGQ